MARSRSCTTKATWPMLSTPGTTRIVGLLHENHRSSRAGECSGHPHARNSRSFFNGLDTYEIRGLRGAKVSASEEEIEYSFILDRPTSEEVSLLVESPFNDPHNLTNPRPLFARLVAI